jgi:sporulation protein YlmC with PRC-barrel domain
MKKGQSIKVFSELRDLEIFDKDGELCGIADDLEFDGKPGGALRVAAILVGPGAYGRRLPAPVRWLVHRLVGQGLVRVPWEAVEHVTSRITLNRTAEELGLNRVERRLRPLIQKAPFA